VSGLSFWSDPIWKGLRIVSFVSATVTVVLLVVFFSGHRSWRVPLDTAIVVNIAVFAALIIRTVIVRAKLHRASKS
jgi:predicted exporter